MKWSLLWRTYQKTGKTIKIKMSQDPKKHNILTLMEIFTKNDVFCDFGRTSNTMNYQKKKGLNLYQSGHCAYITYIVKTCFFRIISVCHVLVVLLVVELKFLLNKTSRCMPQKIHNHKKMTDDCKWWRYLPSQRWIKEKEEYESKKFQNLRF